MIKFLKYAAIISLLKAYKNKLYIFLSIVVFFFLIDYICNDVRTYLQETHPEYLVFVLWVKSIFLVALFITLLILFKPNDNKRRASDGSTVLITSQKDREIVQAVKESQNLTGDEVRLGERVEQHGKEPSGKVRLTEADQIIIEEIRAKNKLETRADKIINDLEDK